MIWKLICSGGRLKYFQLSLSLIIENRAIEAIGEGERQDLGDVAAQHWLETRATERLFCICDVYRCCRSRIDFGRQ